MLNKVPEVTVFFWVIKILCTTVGESFADYVNETLGFGLTNTTVVFTIALVATLVVQFRLRKYVPSVYWLAVVLISVVGTLLTDNLTVSSWLHQDLEHRLHHLGLPVTVVHPRQAQLDHS